MRTKKPIDSAVEHLHTSASVKTVYGEPVVRDGKTITPVARVAYGFGKRDGSEDYADRRRRQGAGREGGWRRREAASLLSRSAWWRSAARRRSSCRSARRGSWASRRRSARGSASCSDSS